MSTKEHNSVHEDANWRARIESELDSARSWNSHWGFLRTDEGHKSLDVEAEELRKEQEQAKTQRTNMSMLSSKTLKTDKRIPKEKYDTQKCTSHEYGWGDNIEKFGSLGNGRTASISKMNNYFTP